MSARLFRATSTGKTRTELIVLMCPQVTLTKLDAYRLRQKYGGHHAFWAGTRSERVSGLPQSGKRQTVSLAAA